MKSVLISIQPKWCELIAKGEKTVEVRKTKPKLETPFKVYIYESSGNTRVGNQNFNVFLKGKGRKKVIGEFVCNCITSLKADNLIQSYYNNTQATCLTDSEIMRYANGGKLYYWHISDLVIYEKPRELSEFATICDDSKPRCMGCPFLYTESNESIGFYEECVTDGLKPLTRPPQSWFYVERLG